MSRLHVEKTRSPSKDSYTKEYKKRGIFGKNPNAQEDCVKRGGQLTWMKIGIY